MKKRRGKRREENNTKPNAKPNTNTKYPKHRNTEPIRRSRPNSGQIGGNQWQPVATSGQIVANSGQIVAAAASGRAQMETLLGARARLLPRQLFGNYLPLFGHWLPPVATDCHLFGHYIATNCQIGLAFWSLVHENPNFFRRTEK